MVEQVLAVIEEFGERMPGGFFIYRANEDEELLYANKAVCDIFGCEGLEDFKELTGFTFRGMVHPEDYATIRVSIEDQIRESQADLDSVEYRIVRKDGQVRWLDDYGHFVRFDDENSLYFVFVSDITDKRAQAESDKALRAAVIEALTKAYDSVWLIHDIQTERFELFRIDKEMEHLIPANIAMKIDKFSQALSFYSRLVLDEDRQQFLDAVTPECIVRNIENKLMYSVSFRRVFDEDVRHYRLEFTKLDLPNGKTGIVAGFKNVDEEVRRERQIQHSLDHRAAVIEALARSYDSVWLINDMETQQFELCRVENQTVHLTPAEDARMIPRYTDAFAYYSQYVLEEDRQRFLEAVTPKRVIENTYGMRTYSVPYRRVFEDGTRNYELEFSKLDIGNGETDFVVGFKNAEDSRKD